MGLYDSFVGKWVVAQFSENVIVCVADGTADSPEPKPAMTKAGVMAMPIVAGCLEAADEDTITICYRDPTANQRGGTLRFRARASLVLGMTEVSASSVSAPPHEPSRIVMG